jgi:GTP pyrophosphokinase
MSSLESITQHATDERAVASGRAIVDIVAQLTDDEDILTGAMLFALLEANALPIERAQALGGPAAARIGTELLRLGSLNLVASSNQSEGLRKMLLAIVTDPRLVLIKLAAQLHKLRESKDAPEAERQRLAYETRQVYAPLANRLGVWQIKWQLEDWSFRYLEPDNYKRVAAWLAAKRGDRER